MADVLDDLRKALRKHGYEEYDVGEGGIVEEALDLPWQEVWINFKTKDSVVLSELHADGLKDILAFEGVGDEDDDEDEEE